MAAVAAVALVGIAVAVSASGAIRVAGVVVAFVARCVLFAGALSGPFTARAPLAMRGDRVPGALSEPGTPAPDYVESNPDAGEADWACERANAEAKRRAERSED